MLSNKCQNVFNKTKETEEEEEFGYSYNDQSLLSKLTFSWIFPLLKRGYSSPIEMEDLQSATSTESTKKHFEKLSKFAKQHSGAIFLPCIQQNWKLIFVAGLARLFADLSSLAGAVCIKLIVQSLSGSNSTSDISFEEENEMSWNDFWANSYVIAVVILLAGIFQGIFSQSSTHLLTVAGTRSMSAIQVLIYKKSLRLSVGRQIAKTSTSPIDNDEQMADSFRTNEGNLDLSFILSLSNEDVSNIREFILNVHYIWALPLKVFAIIYLVQVTANYTTG